MKRRTPIWVHLITGGMTPAFWRECQRELDETNYALLRSACLFSTGMCAFLFLFTQAASIIAELDALYLWYTVGFAALTALTLTAVRRNKRWTGPVFYLYAAALFLLVIAVGTCYSKTIPAVTFHVFLLVIPVLYITRPIYVVLLSMVACAVFILATAMVKGDGFLVQNDILNAVCCCIVGIAFDVTIIDLHLQNIRGKRYFKQQSTTDELTGLPNRRRFDGYLTALLRARASRRGELCLMMMDIDDFKAYNDTYGHVQGDECLRRVSRALDRAARVHDVFLARFGGEEFVAAAMPHGQEADRIAQRLVKCVAELELPHTAAPGGHVTISVGHARWSDCSCATAEELLQRADEALYAAKRAGKDRAVGWTPGCTR